MLLIHFFQFIGSIEALMEMEALGFDIKIVTSPILTSLYCVQEKLNWIRKYLGPSWLKRVIICSDKTAVRGDFLIDDKPYELLKGPLGKHKVKATWKVSY